MKAKLIKVDNGWILMVDNKIYASHNDILSLKNCQAIERGYDLDELADEHANQFMDGKDHFYGFKAGFQKALEILGDKKFSEEDLMETYSRGQTNSPIQSLQQTEWDVKVEMGGYRLNDDGEKIGFPSYELPKLDADGCLILKLKSE